jgi:hypothetical protein
VNINKRAKKGAYPKLEVGDNARVPGIMQEYLLFTSKKKI